jgi:hypothetical protein
MHQTEPAIAGAARGFDPGTEIDRLSAGPSGTTSPAMVQ